MSGRGAVVTPADVARSNQFREGLRLVDYGEVGLPVFRLTLEAITLAHKTMPTIQEFVLRGLAAGESEESAIAAMLGLKLEIIAGAINALVSDGYVARQPAPEGTASFKMTEAGEARLALEREEVPQDEMIVIDYDAIRRAPFRLAGENVVRAAELASSGAIQIRPYPAEPPAVDELDLLDVSKVIRRNAGADFRRTVLALKRIARRNNVFREAVALVFASDKGEEVQVAFAIDGKISEAHERAFAEHGGPRKMGFLKDVGGSEQRRLLERCVGRAMLKRLPDPAELMTTRREEAEASSALSALGEIAARTPDPRKGDPVDLAVSKAEQRLQIAKFNLDAFEVRPLACFEIEELLDEAIGSARSELLITSAGVRGSIVHGFRLRAIDRMLSSGVSLLVKTQWDEQPKGGSRAFDPLAELQKRADNGLLQLQQGVRDPLYYLVQDDELAVISSRPFLGDGAKRSGFTRVEGLVTRKPEIVREFKALATRQAVPRNAS